MKLKGRDWGFIAVAGAVVGILVVLSMIGKKAEPMGERPEHAGMSAVTTRDECLSCHDPTRPGTSAPMPADHPLTWKKETVSCTVCHEPPAAKAPRAAGLAARAATRPAHNASTAGRTSQ